MSRADIAFETIEDRCPTCAKKLLADIGPNLFGHDGATFFCPNCQSAPQARDWESGLRDAIQAVLSRTQTREES